MNKKKQALIALLIIAVGLFFILDISQYLNLAYIKSQQQTINAYYAAHAVKTGALFFIIYILITGISLPGAAIMSLIAGAIFGVVWGTMLVSVGSMFGATIAFLIARYLFKDYVQTRFGQYLEPLNQGIQKEGEWYLLTIRLVPIFPFFIVNNLMALTPIKTVNFALISQLGMLPGTIVFVNAGTQLAKIEAMSDILSPTLLFSFLLLGLFPLVAKKLINLIKHKSMKTAKVEHNEH